MQQERKGAVHEARLLAPQGPRWTVAAVIASVVLIVGPLVVPHLGDHSTTTRVMRDSPATAMDLVNGVANNSPLLIESPVDSRLVILINRIDFPAFSCFLQISGDSGLTWQQVVPLDELPEGVEKCYGPQVAFDETGTLYFLFVGLAGNGNQPVGAYLTKSKDGVRTFEKPVQVLGPHNFGVQLGISQSRDKASRIHLVWLHAAEDPGLGGFPAGDNPILSSYSDDAGATFSSPVRVSNPSRSRSVAPILRIDEDGRLYVVYYDLEGDARDYLGIEGPAWEETWSLVLATSDDQGRSFHETHVVADGLVPSERVMLIFTMASASIAVRRGQLCVTWSDARSGDPDVFLRCATHNGAAWKPMVRVNRDRVGNGHRQYLPAVSLDAAPKRLDVVYFERSDPLGTYNQVILAWSSNGGKTFHAEPQLNHNVSNATLGTRYGVVSAQGQVEFGNRLALLSRPDSALVAWPDTRNTFANSSAQDIFVGGVAFRHHGLTLPAAAPVASAGAGVLVLGWVALAAHRRRRRPSFDPLTSATSAREE